ESSRRWSRAAGRRADDRSRRPRGRPARRPHGLQLVERAGRAHRVGVHDEHEGASPPPEEQLRVEGRARDRRRRNRLRGEAVVLPARLQVLADKIAGAANDVQREQLRSILADYDPNVGEEATEAQLRLLLQAVEEGVPFSRRVVTARSSRRLHGAVAVAVGAAVAVAITLGSQALAFWLPVALAAALVVLTLGTGRGIRLRSGGRRLDLGSRAWISTGPKALPAVRPLANPSPQLVERVRRASSSDAILGAYLYETFDGEHARPTIGIHLREGLPPIGNVGQIAERLTPGEDGTVYAELLDP